MLNHLRRSCTEKWLKTAPLQLGQAVLDRARRDERGMSNREVVLYQNNIFSSLSLNNTRFRLV